MSGRRIFSNGGDATYNNYYNNRNKNVIPLITKPPITVMQASTSYRNDSEYMGHKICSNGACIYPYGHYLASGSFISPPIDPPIVSPIDPLLNQSILEYGVSNIGGNLSSLEEEGVNACIGAIDHGCHIAILPHHDLDTCEPIGCAKNFQQEMELLKNYRFRCFECINPCCPANVVALQIIRDAKSTKSGTTTTTMTYGSTGTTTTTTTTVKP